MVSDLLASDSLVIYLLFLFIVLLLVLLAIYWYRKRQVDRLEKIFGSIAFDRIERFIIPSADTGDIQIDHLLMTPKGFLIIDTKDINGTVFGSDKMSDWTVISDDHRYTFSNPQHALYNRIAAVRQIVRHVPVIGCVLFLDNAKFTTDVPDLVSTLDRLFKEFGEKDMVVAKAKIEAFKPQWDLIKGKAKVI
jgi:hypothetical protein